MIGIAGGVGPHAGLDLLKKVFDQTLAGSDQEHLDVLLFSLPSSIPDRTEYLEGRVRENPGVALAAVMCRLYEAGATVAGIPCNTAHSEAIFGRMKQELERKRCPVQVVHMVGETLEFIRSRFDEGTRIGVLSTTGTYRSAIYRTGLESAGMIPVVPPGEMQERRIHPAIYDPVFGIKSRPSPIDPRALEGIREGMKYLEEKGARAVILGCTEIALACPLTGSGEMIPIDPTLLLARALIREAFPAKLKPLHDE